jgi:hypothetical protein
VVASRTSSTGKRIEGLLFGRVVMFSLPRTFYVALFMILSRAYVIILILVLQAYPETLQAVQSDNIHHYYGGLVSIMIGLILYRTKYRNFFVYGGIGVLIEEIMIILEQFGLLKTHLYLSSVDYLTFISILLLMIWLTFKSNQKSLR